jgi:hypothetical protein
MPDLFNLYFDFTFIITTVLDHQRSLALHCKLSVANGPPAVCSWHKQRFSYRINVFVF